MAAVMSLPDFMRVESLGGAARRTLGLRQTEQFLLLATYHLWREDAPVVDGEALDKLRGALSPHAERERNRQFSHNVLEMALDRLMTAGLVERRADSLAPTARAVDELERAMAATRKSPEAMLRRLLED
jgi:hypothetical protein